MALTHITRLKKLENKTVLLRVDWNVSIKKGHIVDDYKIESSLKTITYLLNKGARVVVISHFGRPKGKVTPNYSLKPIVNYIQKEYGLHPILFDDLLNKPLNKLKKKIDLMEQGEFAVLENIRFYKEEAENSSSFSKKIASLGDIYVNDAFASCHREHASVVGIPKYMKSYTGFLLREEIKMLNHVLKPSHPAIAVMGGGKVETKIRALNNIANKYDYVLLGVGLAKAIWEAQGIMYGKPDLSFSKEDIKNASKVWKKYKDKLILPIDIIGGTRLDGTSLAVHRTMDDARASEYALDIGPCTITLFSEYLKSAETIIWNGPLGLFEFPQFKHGTQSIATYIGARSKKHAFAVAGGGETIVALNASGVYDNMNFVSTGGGAMIEYLYNQNLPGIKALK